MKKFLIYTTTAVLAMATIFTSCRKDVNVTGVTLNRTEGMLTVSHTDTLIATVLPRDAKNRNVIWSSSDEDIATVSQTGIVTAVAEGTVTITVTTDEGGFRASCVYEIVAQYWPVTGITLSRDENLTFHFFDNGSSAGIGRLDATITPENATNKEITWTTSNPNVIRILPFSETAIRIQATGVGTATITATTTDGGHTAVRNITVSDDVVLPHHCIDHPFNLGVASFFTDQIWEVGDQIWSDIVTATGCALATDPWDGADHGGTWFDGFMTYCRQSVDADDNVLGHGFTWCAVMRFRDQLCPYPWRVPSGAEFVALDIALGGNGETESSMEQDGELAQRILDRYVEEWGARSIGTFMTFWEPHVFERPGLEGGYWSWTEITDMQVESLLITKPGAGSVVRVQPQGGGVKTAPMALRCVRDK